MPSNSYDHSIVYMIDDLVNKTPADSNAPNILISFDSDAKYTFYSYNNWQLTKIDTEYNPGCRCFIPEYYDTLDKIFSEICNEHQGLHVGIYTNNTGAPTRRIFTPGGEDISIEISLKLIKGRFNHEAN